MQNFITPQLSLLWKKYASQNNEKWPQCSACNTNVLHLNFSQTHKLQQPPPTSELSSLTQSINQYAEFAIARTVRNLNELKKAKLKLRLTRLSPILFAVFNGFSFQSSKYSFNTEQCTMILLIKLILIFWSKKIHNLLEL